MTVSIDDIPQTLKNKDTWKQYPAAMLRAMTARQLVRAAAPDIVLGLPGMSLEDVDETPEDTFDFHDHAPQLSAPDPPHIDDDPPIDDDDRDSLRAALDRLSELGLTWVKTQAQQQSIPNLANGADHRRPFRASHAQAVETLIGQANELYPAEPAAPEYAPGEEPFE